MLIEIKNIIFPTTKQTFFAFTQEFFFLYLGYNNTENLDAFLTRIKILNKKIKSIKIEFTADTCILLVLILGLINQYKSLVRIWGTIPGLIAEHAIQILRVDTQREEDKKRIKSSYSYRASSRYNHSIEEQKHGMVAVGHKRRAGSTQVSVGKKITLDYRIYRKHT
jgi:hypothetical protein